jgi:hypothetical protein
LVESRDYLLSYGKAGDFGRFQAQQPLACRRGQQLVVRSQRGEELATVMRPAAPGHAPLLGGQSMGSILRLAGQMDLELAKRLHFRSHSLFLAARQLAADHSVPVEILDAEILLDGRQGVLYCLKAPDLETSAFVAALARRSQLGLCLRDMALPPSAESDREGEGCGDPNCGARSGSCGSCSSGACSSCSLHHAILRPASPA